MFRLTAKVTTNPINQSGIIAGAIGGESIVLVVLVNTLLLRAFAQGNLPSTDPEIIAWNAIYPFLIIAIFEGWGVFAAWLCIASIKTRNEAFIGGFIPGIVIGILLEVMWVAQLTSLVSHQVIPYSGIAARIWKHFCYHCGPGYFRSFGRDTLRVWLIYLLPVQVITGSTGTGMIWTTSGFRPDRKPQSN